MMRLTLASSALAAATAVVLLSACSTPRHMPEGPDAAEVQEILAEENADWWRQMFPGAPQPSVDVVEFVAAEDWVDAMIDCATAAGIEGLSESNGTILFEPPEGTQRAMNEAYFICFQQYPVEQTGDAGLIGKAQISWLYDYFDNRLAPCLRLLGYRIPDPPTRDEFVESFYAYGVWTPYSAISQAGTDWDLLDAQCPPPPELFEFLHP